MRVVAFFDFSQQFCPYFCFFVSSMKLLFMSCVGSFWGHYIMILWYSVFTHPQHCCSCPGYSPVLSLSTVASSRNALLVFPAVLLLMLRIFSCSFPGYCCQCPRQSSVLSRLLLLMPRILSSSFPGTAANAQDTLQFFPGVLLLMPRILSTSFLCNSLQNTMKWYGYSATVNFSPPPQFAWISNILSRDFPNSFCDKWLLVLPV